jgi:hypothetical protein
VEGNVGPQSRPEAADALAAPSRGQDEGLELAPTSSAWPSARASGVLPAGSRIPSDPTRASSRLSGRRGSAAVQPVTKKDSVRRCLCLTQALLRAGRGSRAAWRRRLRDHAPGSRPAPARTRRRSAAASASGRRHRARARAAARADARTGGSPKSSGRRGGHVERQKVTGQRSAFRRAVSAAARSRLPGLAKSGVPSAPRQSRSRLPASGDVRAHPGWRELWNSSWRYASICARCSRT